MFGLWKNDDDRFTLEVVEKVGAVKKTYRLTVPASTSIDEIEEMLIVIGAIEPRIEITHDPGPLPLNVSDR